MLTIEDYHEMRDDQSGYCTHCKGIVNHGNVEPDAENYRCEECESLAVIGADNALVMGYVH